jgi:hypothetical protein
MKTTFLTALAVSFFLSIALFPKMADAQKQKHEKIIIRSSGGDELKLGSMRDTLIVSKDGKDTTIIKTTREGNKKNITVRKIITSGNEKDSTLTVEAITGLPDDDMMKMMKHRSNGGKTSTMKVVKVIKGDGSDSYTIEESGPGGLAEDEDILFDEPACAKHSCVKVIRSDAGDFESEENGNVKIIYLNNDRKGNCCKMKRQRGKHQKIYIIVTD